MAYFMAAADDAFDDEAEDNMVVQKEWDRTENDIRKSGYRLGLSAGQEETLQQGFDAGYKEAVLIAFAVGKLQGQISANLSLLESATDPTTKNSSPQPETSKLAANLMTLLEDCAQFHHSIPQKLQSQGQQQIMAELPAGLNQAQLHTGNQTKSLGSDDRHSSSFEHDSQNQQGAGDSLREVTELLGAVGLQDLPPIRNPELRQCLLDLLRRYHSLLPR
ncbi:hypothetical protein V1264_014019 [Littorina saxatilis]|uniref:Essential protein Yae1 N-terminal domain-containing protein n=2 Tax=Littorina saxatilis TaxID=31220 RepID=A0AAN9GKJ4_9CAEN